MAQYVPVRRGDLVTLYATIGGAPYAFSNPPQFISEEYEKKVDVTDKMKSLWVVLEWVPPNHELSKGDAPKRLSYYVKVTSDDRVCWVKEYYLDVVRRA